MDNKLYKARQKAKKELGSNKNITEIKNKQALGETLTFAERNILKIYDKRLLKAIKRSLK